MNIVWFDTGANIMCTCLCVCVCVYAHAYTHTHTHTHRIIVPSSSLSLMQWIVVLVRRIGLQLGNKYTTFHGTQSFITLFTRAHQVPPVLSQINPVSALLSYFFKTDVDITLTYASVLCKHLFPSEFLTKALNVSLFSVMCTTCPAFLI